MCLYECTVYICSFLIFNKRSVAAPVDSTRGPEVVSVFVVQTLLTSKTILRSFTDAPPCVRVCLVSSLWHGQVRFLSLRSLDGLCIRLLVYPFSYASICPSIYSPSDLCGVHYLHHRCVFLLCLPCSYHTHNPLAHITLVLAHGCPTHHPHLIS